MPVLGPKPDIEAVAAKLAGVPRPWYVDVGSGGDPVPFANILVEKFLGETYHRLGPFQDEGKIVVQGDLSSLPFLDKAVDFIWCSHVLEHLDDPEEGLNELQRVASKGVAFVPTPWAEAIYQKISPGRAIQHRWLCWSATDKAIFFECDTRNKERTIETLKTLRLWPAPSVAMACRSEVRIGWGWGAWPDRMRVEKWKFDPSKEEDTTEWLHESDKINVSPD